MSTLSKDSKTDGLLQKVVEAFTALGVPGLLLLVVLELTGFAGAAALTSALAILGGPLGMLGGLGVLAALLLGCKALTRYGIEKIASGVIRKLVASGESVKSIRIKVEQYPRWIVKADVRRKLLELLSLLGDEESEGTVPVI
jgi:hypothetical protein